MQARPKILIVEDEPAQREILLYHLKKAGFEALWADNGEEGLLLAQENLPDLLILDWMLPKLSGLEVCRRLRAHQDTKHIPIILLSARSEEADKVQGLDIGADDYVAKPYSVMELMARVKTQLPSQPLHPAAPRPDECQAFRKDGPRARVQPRQMRSSYNQRDLRQFPPRVPAPHSPYFHQPLRPTQTPQ